MDDSLPIENSKPVLALAIDQVMSLYSYCCVIALNSPLFFCLNWDSLLIPESHWFVIVSFDAVLP